MISKIVQTIVALIKRLFQNAEFRKVLKNFLWTLLSTLADIAKDLYEKRNKKSSANA